MRRGKGKTRITDARFMDRLRARAVDVAKMHGPENMTVHAAFSDFNFRAGVVAAFVEDYGNRTLRQGVRFQPWRHRKPNPEAWAWDCVTKLIAWYRGRVPEYPWFGTSATATTPRNPRSRGRRPGRKVKLLHIRRGARRINGWIAGEASA